MPLTDYQPTSDDPRVADVEREVVERAQAALERDDDLLAQERALQQSLREIGVDCTREQAASLLDLVDDGDLETVQDAVTAIVADAG